MQRLHDVLSAADLRHLHLILGHREDASETDLGTKRRVRVNQITIDDTYISDQAREPFRALSQDERERLLSDLVWQLTCFVEGSSTRSGKSRSIDLESGFKMRRFVQAGRPSFCVVKKG
jgi:hypothetical protein